MAKVSRLKTDSSGKEIKKPTRYYSSKQENKVAKELNIKTTKNSGATTFQKGDILSNKFLLECKTQTKSKDSFSVKKDWFIKNKLEQITMSKDYSAIVFNFGPDEENYYIIDENLFKRLLEYLDGGETYE